ncbi:MAG: glycosyltransferase family 39 protein [Phycisphaerae bacterium]
MQQVDMISEISSYESRHRQILQVLLLLIVSSAVFVAGIGKLALTDPDEGRYALISKNMIDRHNFLVPWLGENYYSDKPPLYFWMTAGCLKIFGLDNPQFSARIVPVLGGLLTILATYLVASTLFNHMLGLLSAGCLLSTVMMVGCGKFVRMDIYLVALTAMTLWAFLKGYKQQGPTRWFLLIYPFLALGTLIKGPVAIVIPTAIIFLFLVWQWLIGQGDWKVLNHMRLILGLAIIIVLAGPWFLYMVTQYPGYAHEFFSRQNFERAVDNQSQLGHHTTPLIYAATLLIGFVPWTGLAVLAVARYTKSALGRGSRDWESKFLFLWFALIMIFFTIAKARLFHYVFPVFVPVAIFLGRFLYDYWQSDFPRRRRQLTFAWAYPAAFTVWISVVILYILAAFGSGWLQFHERWIGLPDLYGNSWFGRWGWIITLVYRLAIAVVLIKTFWYLWRNWQLPQLVMTIGAAFLLLMVDVSYTDLPRAADLASCRRLTPLVKKNCDVNTPILEGPVTHNQRWSLPFYLGNGYTIKYFSRTADLADYYKNPGKMIYLIRDEDTYNQCKYILGQRIEVLAHYSQTRLLLIKPKIKGSQSDLAANYTNEHE